MKTSLIAVAVGLSACGLLAISAAPRMSEAAAASAPVAADTWTIDGGHSSVIFRVQHVGLTNFYGRFNKVDGSFVFDPAAVESANFDVVINADSVDTNSKDRDAHLKSPTFFNTKEHGTMTFKSTGVKKEGDAFELSGDLTMLGVTKPVKAKLTWGGSGDKGERMGVRAGLEATFNIKRSDFGMNYGVKEGMLGDDVMLIVALEGTKK